MEKCSACGAPLHSGTCAYCGATSMSSASVAAVSEAPSGSAPVAAPQPQATADRIPDPNPVYSVPLKRKWTAFVLCLLLGLLGAHYFYVNKPILGVLYIFTIGLFGIGWVVDLIRILIGAFRDGYGRELEA